MIDIAISILWLAIGVIVLGGVIFLALMAVKLFIDVDARVETRDLAHLPDLGADLLSLCVAKRWGPALRVLPAREPAGRRAALSRIRTNGVTRRSTAASEAG
jgi:hypothetical protein